MSIVPRRSTFSFIHLLALRASFFLLSHLFSAVLCQSSTAHVRLDDASPEVLFTPSECNQGRAVSADDLPGSCDHTWFIASNERNESSHVTRSSSSRAVLHFEGSGVDWFSAPVKQARGAADVFVDNVRVERVYLSPNNTGPDLPVWSRTGLNPNILHNLTIVPVGDGFISVDFFILNPLRVSIPDTLPSPLIAAAAEAESGAAYNKDASSGTVISLASIASVAVVVAICGGCFFLGRRQKRPGFHMPTVLVDIESALDHPDPPSPTTIRAWRESTRQSITVGGEPRHDRYPPDGAPCSRPPSYRSGKDSLYRSESSLQSHDGPWQ